MWGVYFLCLDPGFGVLVVLFFSRFFCLFPVALETLTIYLPSSLWRSRKLASLFSSLWEDTREPRDHGHVSAHERITTQLELPIHLQGVRGICAIPKKLVLWISECEAQVNRTPKLKQCKLDVRREQWLCQPSPGESCAPDSSVD